jgi:sulfur carrier protein
VGASDATEQLQTIRLNGDPFALRQPLAVADLLRQLNIDARRVAVEVNGLVVKRARYDTTIVSPGDEVEVVHFVGGG